LHSALYTGWVSHRRRLPRMHAFRYPLFMVLLDLAELDQAFRGRWLWGVERRRIASFRRADHMGEPHLPLAQCVRDLVERESGRRPDGPVRLLTHLRYFGYCFNPVCFYYCYDATDREVVAVVAEVNNTPWGERHCYVLDHRGLDRTSSDAPLARWRSDKRLHVSPFMPMDLQYEWALSAPAARLAVHMHCSRDGEPLFDAALTLRRRPLTGSVMAGTLLRYPWTPPENPTFSHWKTS